MRIAVTYENGNVFQHFGHSEQFKIYDVLDGEIKTSTVISTHGSGHGALADLLKKENVDTLICGGIGGGAKNMLAAADIKLYGGVCGSADEAVSALLAGGLQFNPNVECSHHGAHGHGHECHDGHGDSGHSCGGHAH